MAANGSRPLRARWSGPRAPAVPRSAWQRFGNPGTDSGWPLLTANFAVFAFLALRHFVGVLQGSALFGLLALGFALVAFRTGCVMWRVAGRRGRGT